MPVDAALAKQMEELSRAGLPGTVQLTPGRLTIRCNNMEDLLRQLVLLAKNGRYRLREPSCVDRSTGFALSTGLRSRGWGTGIEPACLI